MRRMCCVKRKTLQHSFAVANMYAVVQSAGMQHYGHMCKVQLSHLRQQMLPELCRRRSRLPWQQPGQRLQGQQRLCCQTGLLLLVLLQLLWVLRLLRRRQGGQRGPRQRWLVLLLRRLG